ncbi:Rne/Rng family ribonuclease [Spirillospora sp. NPDC047279]|uniref:Rne/Rng family ribonuclease n=1 Tax=Spirillospora sp. NPDC047279 TaxID=3155478 RepID=UPI0033D0783C
MLDNESDSANAESTDNTTAVVKTTRTRRRAASRPAGPPPEIDDTPRPPAPADSTATAAAAAAAAASETPPPPPAQAVEAAEDSAAPDPAGDEAAPPKKATRTRTTRTRTTKAKAAGAKAADAGAGDGAGEQGGASEPAAAPETATAEVAETAAAPEAATAAEEPAKATRTRSRRRTAAATAEEPAVPEVPSVPTAEAEEAGEAAGGVPGVSFQPPMVVFQAPEPTSAPAKAKSKAKPKSEPKDEPKDEEPEDEADEAGSAEHDEDDESGDRPSRRRRRRGGRGRGRAGKDGEGDDEDDGDAEEAPAPAAKPSRSRKAKDAQSKEQSKDEPAAEGDQSDDESGDDDDEGGNSSRRRRRRRRRSGTGDSDGVADDPPNTVTHVRSARSVESRAAEDEVQSVRGSTRLEAKKQRRREGREQGRRRPPVITEAEFLARREAVKREMVVRQEGERTQIAVLEDDVLVEHYVNRATHQSYVGNVYLGKVQNVLPSMEAAFVDIGKGRNAVLYAGEVNWDVAGLEGQPRRIESALKSGQSVLVQVTKDPLGHKGARLTSQVSLPGRYLVYVPDGSMTGISRKLPDKERSRLKSILKKVMPEHAGVIVRTAAEGATEEELSRDVSRLAAQWDNIQKQVKTASAPSLLYGEPDLTIRVVRDIFNEDFTKLVVSGGDAWDTVADYVQYVAPHLADRVERWDGDQDAMSAYRIDEQIAKALDRKVWLPSGGSLVIDRTEAMTVIDVNTGKFTGQGGNLEETVTRNNLEAAEEIVRQLRLRDIGGIIVIDFIDMVLESNRDLVLRRMVECLSRDRTKHQVAEVTSLGLVQMTRKRVGQGLLEAFSETCESCNGRGIHVHLTPVEPKAEGKAAGKEGGRRRKRKGEVEKAVEDKLAKQQNGKPDEESDEEAVTDAAEAAIEATETVPGTLEPGSGEAAELNGTEDEAVAGNGRRRRARRPRAKAEAGAED